MNAGDLVRAVRGAGTAGGPRAALGRWWRLRPGAARRSPDAGRARVPGLLERVEPEPGGGVVRFARSSLRVRVATGGAVFLGWDGAEPAPSSAVPEVGCPPVDARVTLEPHAAGGWRVVSERVSVVVAQYGAVEIRTPGGLLLRRDLPPRWWESSDRAADGRVVQRSVLTSDADVFGLGGRAAGPGLPDGGYRLWQVGEEVVDGPGGPSPLALPVQLVVADAGSHLVFHDVGGDGELTLRHGTTGEGSGHDRPGRCLLRLSGGTARYWVLPGPPARALRGWRALTGAAAVPPVWALGYQHAVGRGEAGELPSLVAAFRERGVPLSGLHLAGSDGPPAGSDGPPAGSGSGERAGGGDELPGVRLVRGVDSRVPLRPGAEFYESGLAAEVFVPAADGTARPAVVAGPEGRAVVPDFTDPGARKWWGESYLPLCARGASAYWLRPFGARAAGPEARGGLPPRSRLTREGRGGELREAHHELPLAMARATHEYGGEAGLWSFSDGAWAGSHRYGGVCARVPEGWEGMRAAVSTVLGLGLCGVPFAGVDVREELSTELGQRWFQLGAWLPLFRTFAESAGVPRWPSDRREADGLVAAVARRERLLPYLATLAQVASVSGAPPVRPLWWHTPADRGLRTAREVDFLLGDAFLVAPVCEPGVRERRVRLPRGAWYDTATGEVRYGPGTVTVAAPATRLPVLVRAGAVVPVAEPDGGVALEVWAPAAGRTGGGLRTVPKQPTGPGGQPTGPEGQPTGDGTAAGTLRRYAVAVRDGEPVVTREDGRAPELPVRVRGRGA
ncbi:glycoside hydrolase family 31 protein [Streptomyces sp. XM4193]|uniref:glycoside hydrolase family 31 protein n=1 Tax=Streptomyces sp. XM4193 TaxID=2929782 RepID=UPI001FFAA2EF|nr:glycoside hydrolase family 31 protein [Streptomyces sp. XM4193]MCK1797673.1 glycoside hydrolase family 31 protein [Streptomyces sp. XM4193]